MMVRTPWLVAVSLILAGHASVLPAQETSNQAEAAAQLSAESVAKSIGRAEAVRYQAAELRVEWLETGSLIEQARKEAGLGHYEKAMALADKARQQGELAVEQYERESEAWQQRVVR